MADHRRFATSESSLTTDHERTDANAAGVALALGGLGLFLILAALSPMVILPWIARNHRLPDPRVEQATLPPEPRLDPDPIGDNERIRAAEMARLNSYGFNDAAHTSMHVPIDVAMEAVAQQIQVVPPAAPRAAVSAGVQAGSTLDGSGPQANNPPQGRRP